MNKKKLSIIIPVYNCELYIGKLLNQLDQLDKDLVEIIIVNDGSTVCGYIHEGPLPEGFTCPRCKQPASVFVKV